MAVTANQLIQAMDFQDHLRHGLVDASRRLYQGTICFFERTSAANEGYLTDLDDTGNNTFAGIVKEDANNASGSAGDISAEFFVKGAFVLEGTGFHIGLVNDLAYASDNFTVTHDSSSATWIGKFVEFISATKMRVELFGVITDPT